MQGTYLKKTKHKNPNLCIDALTIFILMKNLSVLEDLWMCSLENSWQRMNEIAK